MRTRFSRTLVSYVAKIKVCSAGYSWYLDVRGYRKELPVRVEIPNYTLRNIATDFAAVIDELGNGKAILFGQSGARLSSGIQPCSTGWGHGDHQPQCALLPRGPARIPSKS